MLSFPWEGQRTITSRRWNCYAEVFRRIRSMCLAQGIIDEDDGTPTCPTGKIKYSVLGEHVCRDAFCKLYGIGRHPRLNRILRAVREKMISAPIDGRSLKMAQQVGGTQTSEAQVAAFALARAAHFGTPITRFVAP